MNLELSYSRDIHNKGTPLLLSSKFLRSYGGGQVDIACFINNRIFIYEIKSSWLGVIASQRTQKMRLIGTMLILERITQKEVILKYLKKDFAN